MKPIKFSTKRKFFFSCDIFMVDGIYRLLSLGLVGEFGNEAMLFNDDVHPDLQNASNRFRSQVAPYLPHYPGPRWLSEVGITKEVIKFMSPSKDNPVELWGDRCAYTLPVLFDVLQLDRAYFGEAVEPYPGISSLDVYDLKSVSYIMSGGTPEDITDVGSAVDRAKAVRDRFAALQAREKFDL